MRWNRGPKIYPIIVNAVDIQAVPWLKRMNIRPRDAKALASYSPAKRDEVMASLASEIREIVENASTPVPEKNESPPLPGKTAVSNIPLRVPLHFLGRDDDLQAIETLALPEGRVAITTLHGLRGVGKSTLAPAYAERNRNHYRATWWVRAQTEPSMRADHAEHDG